jgi:bacterioferritin-associated ferredoxin
MVICSCNALTTNQIAAAVAAGADRPHDVYAACGCQAQCGCCTRTILEMVRAGVTTASR